MDLYDLKKHCKNIATTALLIFIILCFFLNVPIFILLRVIVAEIALIAFSIRCGAEIITHQKLSDSIILIVICFFNIIISVLSLF